MRCHLTQETRVYDVEDDVAGIICQAPPPALLAATTRLMHSTTNVGGCGAAFRISTMRLRRSGYFEPVPSDRDHTNVARHVIDARFGPSFLELRGIL